MPDLARSPTRDLRWVCHTKAPMPHQARSEQRAIGVWKKYSEIPPLSTHHTTPPLLETSTVPPLHVSEIDRQIAWFSWVLDGGDLVNIETKSQLFWGGWQKLIAQAKNPTALFRSCSIDTRQDTDRLQRSWRQQLRHPHSMTRHRSIQSNPSPTRTQQPALLIPVLIHVCMYIHTYTADKVSGRSPPR
jgi:hypothetical protein